MYLTRTVLQMLANVYHFQCHRFHRKKYFLKIIFSILSSHPIDITKNFFIMHSRFFLINWFGLNFKDITCLHWTILTFLNKKKLIFATYQYRDHSGQINFQENLNPVSLKPQRFKTKWLFLGEGFQFCLEKYRTFFSEDINS